MKKPELIRLIVPLVMILGAYMGIRLIAIRDLPPFNDEILYVRWAQQGFFDASKRLISLSDGKQPLYIWLTSLLMNWIPSPLAAGRIVSVLSGSMTVIGLAVLSYMMFKSRHVAILAAALYVLFPEALLLDRFALYDSLLAALWVWNLIIMYGLVRNPGLSRALVLALVLGASLLVKSSAVFLLIILPAMAVIYGKRGNFVTIAGYFLLAVSLAFVYQSVQHLSPLVSFIAEKNALFAYGWRDLSAVPLASQVDKNAPLFFGWVTSYLSWPLFLFALIGSFWDRKNWRSHAFLWIASVLPFLAVVLVGKIVYPRHLFFFTVPLLILIASSTAYVWQRIDVIWVRIAVLFVCLSPFLYMSGRMLIDFKSSLLPKADRFQYIEGWPAGWGIKEIARILEREAQSGQLTILTEGTFGSMPTTAMELYLGNYPQVTITAIDDKTLTLPEFVDWEHDVYAVLNINQAVPGAWNAEELLKIRKGNGNSYMRLFKLNLP